MCGIAGFFSTGTDAGRMESIGRSMADAIAHRGPDSAGVWLDAKLGLVLVHRRLAVVDLTVEGHQPMLSASGRFAMTYNGEIYNVPEMRARIESAGHPVAWRGHSDTEVLLAAFELWGVERAMALANGMFALAVLDRSSHELVLARDRLGEKPLYYGWSGNAFLFASELKALLRHPSFTRRLNTDVLGQYLRFGYVPAPSSIYSGIGKLGAGQLLTLSLDAARAVPVVRNYWTAPLPENLNDSSEEEATQRLDELLREAIRCRMQADVPLGAFLSGGVDSSTIVALAQAQSTRAVRTFSIGFQEKAHDESEHARAVAAVLGTEHTELFVTSRDALEVIPSLPMIYDEPFSDSSQIPTYLLAKLTRAHVTVALSGDGGDELFGGYHRYFHGRQLSRLVDWMPALVRSWGANLLAAVPGRQWDRLLSFAPQGAAFLLGGDRMAKLSNVLREDNCFSIYKRLVSQWRDPSVLLPGSREQPTVLDDAKLAADIGSPVSWMMYMDQLTYLPDDILVKVDRATMAVALESRVPFLDPNVVAFAAGLPLNFKMRGNTGKWLLKRVLYRYVDKRLFDRPKQGFGVPLAEWLRGPLREWAEDLLSPTALQDTFFVDPAQVQRAWQAHMSGRENLHYPLWVLLMYQMWHRQYRPSVA